jgi:hypothetical protein
MSPRPRISAVTVALTAATALVVAALPVFSAPTDQPTGHSTDQSTEVPARTPCPTWTPEPYDFKVDVQVHGNLLRGRTLPDGEVGAVLSDAGGSVKASAQGRAEPSGVYVLEFEDSDGKPIEIEPGWTVLASGPNGEATISPPHLSLFIELTGGKLIGEGPPNADLRVISSYTGGVRHVRTDAEGKFNEVWLPEREGPAGPWGEVFYDLPGGHSVFARDRILSLTVEINSPYIKVTGPPMSHLSASVEKSGPGRFLLGTVAGPASGWGESIFGMVNQATKEDLPIVPGLRVLATSELVPEVEHRIDPVPELSGKVAPGGGSVVGWTRPRAVVRARLYWPPDPLDPCNPTYVERMAVASESGGFAIPLESRATGPLPRPLEDAERLILAHRTVWGDEVVRPISTDYGELVSWLYLPNLRRDPAR